MDETNQIRIRVTCAIIERDGLVMAAQRGPSMRMPLQWEFPGGKIEPMEETEAALHRELMEEMGLRVVVKREIPPSTHHYPDFTVTLYPFVCAISAGGMTLHEHHAVVWLRPDELPTLNWVEADRAVVDAYRRQKKESPLV